MLPQWAGIRARSRQEALDWSLVLASQGIDPTIQYQPAAGGWLLIVQRAQFEPAVAAIRQFHRENRGWHWRQHVASSEFTFHWGALVWCWTLILFHWWSWAWGGGLELAGTTNERIPQTGEWWRLWTATTLHADVGHLAANATAGILVLGLAMGRYGAGWALLGATLAGVFGNALGLAVRQSAYTGLGASGVVMGALGLLAVYSAMLYREVPGSKRHILAGIGGGVLLFALLGTSPRGDIWAHGGGFVGGIVAGLVLGRLSPKTLAGWRANLFAGLACGLNLLAAWILALLTHG